ncbi:hypothetical protein ONS95_005889 [Cadophora gregata]|uniref:uncharacterized protein n=1 Tax=Cadophora gregata TaxID=51156 RepID=UPI0026DD9AB9|nr:uncharacterized protein ONS95_005889 [Cadophora gregata]KAK0102267.1 hypothetical protein ONS95_005889 [Cadophora gregata]
MKYRAWIGQAVSAFTDGNGSRRKDGNKKRNTQSGKWTGEEVAAEVPRLPIAEQFSSENWKLRLESSKPVVIESRKAVPIQIPGKSIPKLEEEEVEWSISGSTSSDTLPMRADSQASTSSSSSVTLSTITESAHGSIPYEHAELDGLASTSSATPASLYGSSTQALIKTQAPTRPSLRYRTKSFSSVILEQSPSAPITIILTTPDSDPPSPDYSSPPPSYFSSQHQGHFSPSFHGPSLSKTKYYTAARPIRSFSSPSIPTLASSPGLLSPNWSTTSLPSTYISPFPDPNKLIAPSEQALDISRLRKAQEFRQVRKFMIDFLNAKGHTFPPKLRLRILAGYGIEEKELHPETVKRFAISDSVAETDEGVALDGVCLEDSKAKGISNAENLRILSMAFQSQIPLVTPHLEEAYLKATPGRLPMHRPRTLLEEREMRLLGRTLSTSDLPLRQSTSQSKTRSSISEYGSLKASASPPDLSRRYPVTPDTASMPRSVSGRTGEKTKMHVVGDRKQMGIVEQQTRIKRQSIISGAFGAVREAMGGGSVGKERERRRIAGSWR